MRSYLIVIQVLLGVIAATFEGATPGGEPRSALPDAGDAGRRHRHREYPCLARLDRSLGELCFLFPLNVAGSYYFC